MSATKNMIEEKVAEYAAKHAVGFDDLMDAFNVMNDIGIKFDYTTLEKKLIRIYHLMQYVRSLENDI